MQFLKMLKGNNDREWFQKNKARYESGVVARFHRGYGESTAENFNMLPDDREVAEWIADADLQVYSFHEKQDSVQNEHWYPLSTRSRLYGTRSRILPSLRARRLLHRSWYLTTRQATVVANSEGEFRNACRLQEGPQHKEISFHLRTEWRFTQASTCWLQERRSDC